ncbi:MAG: (2Fe-2S) ferredoxin domain-containing protein [DPANN group archaeon]|nr:(2Fe-2S) ferredoxin domain-containing protein [DPANN group archaeon]
MDDILFQKPEKHFFICINDRTIIDGNRKSSCGPKIKPEDVDEVKKWLLQQGLAGQVYCTKVKCLGFCNPIGGVAAVYPTGKFVKGLQNSEDIKKFVAEELQKI